MEPLENVQACNGIALALLNAEIAVMALFWRAISLFVL